MVRMGAVRTWAVRCRARCRQVRRGRAGQREGGVEQKEEGGEAPEGYRCVLPVITDADDRLGASSDSDILDLR